MKRSSLWFLWHGLLMPVWLGLMVVPLAMTPPGGTLTTPQVACELLGLLAALACGACALCGARCADIESGAANNPNAFWLF